jgi:hypothetical protein
MRTIQLSAVLVLGLLLPAAASAQAQEGYLRKPPSAGEEVVVTQSTSGTEVRGRIVELSPTTLAMLVDGKRVDMPINTVLRIDALTDSVKNGALIGGGVFLGWTVLSCATLAAEADNCPQAILVSTLFGTLAGAGIDAMIQGRTTIYSKPPSTVSLAVAPTRKGARAQFTVRW